VFFQLPLCPVEGLSWIHEKMNESETIPFARRCVSWAAAWLVAGTAMVPMAGLLPFFSRFPLGLFRFLLSEDAYQESALSFRFSPPLLMGWLVYAVLTVLGLCFAGRAR
jgi:hypothetical protein